MNRAEKAAVIDEIAANITGASAIFAVDYRGITVQQAADLRTRLRDADATLRVVKNSLTERAADKVGADQLKAMLAGPTALTFVRGDSAAAAKSIADFARTTQLLAFKGGLMGDTLLSPAEITTISRLPSRDVLYGQLVSLVANPISGLARTLNALIGNLAIGLGQVRDQKQSAEPAPAVEQGPPTPDPAAEAPPEPDATQTAPEAQAPADEPQAAGQPEEESPQAGSDDAPADEPQAADQPEEESPQAGSDDAPADEPQAAGQPEEESPQAGSDDAGSDDTSQPEEESPPTGDDQPLEDA
ncbi:MAG: 50S ribosomal protein L10 [Solirubrobacteraceae bacterium]|jgi:large subunit ribosomal protein L10